MSRPLLLAGSLSLAALIAPLPALAQGVVANELWEAWQKGVASAGGTLSAVENREGNKLVLQDLRLDTGEDGGVLQLETVTLINQADGSVGVVLPETFPLVIELPDPPETALPEGQDAAPEAGAEAGKRAAPERMVLAVEAPDLRLIVRGLGQRAEFEADAPRITVALERFIPPLPAEEGDIHLTLALDGAALRYLQDFAVDVPLIDGALSFDGLDAVLAVAGNADGDGTLSLVVGRSEASLSGGVPASFAALQESSEDPGLSGILAVLGDGLRGKLAIGLGPLALRGDLDLVDPQAPESFELSAASASVNAGLDAVSIGYEAAMKTLQLAVTGGLPELQGDAAEMGLEEFRVSTKLGLNGMRGPQDWGMAWILRDFTMSDALWNKGDPTHALPREPLTFALDLAGRYSLPPALLEPGQTIPDGKLPFDMLGMRINEFDLSLFGVSSEGEGGLDFDMSDLTTFDGFPTPSGRLSFVTKGAYRFIELAASLGQLTPEEVTGARAALLMLGRAGEEPDTLHTDLDFRDKSFFLNGIKIR